MQLPRLVKICLILISLSLVSCSNFPKLTPHVVVYNPQLNQMLCGEYEVVKQDDACAVEYKFKQWHPLEKCHGYFALSPEDISALKKYQAGMCANK